MAPPHGHLQYLDMYTCLSREGGSVTCPLLFIHVTMVTRFSDIIKLLLCVYPPIYLFIYLFIALSHHFLVFSTYIHTYIHTCLLEVHQVGRYQCHQMALTFLISENILYYYLKTCKTYRRSSTNSSKFVFRHTWCWI